MMPPLSRIACGVDPGQNAGWGFIVGLIPRSDPPRPIAIPAHAVRACDIVGNGTDPGRPWRWGVCHGGLSLLIQRILGTAGTYQDATADEQMDLIDWGPRGITMCLGIEDQYVGLGTTRADLNKARSTLGVAENRGRWTGIAEVLGYETMVLHPSTWRSAMLGKTWVNKPRAQVKAYALTVVKSLWGIDLPKSQDHVAESLLLASYVDTVLRERRRGFHA